MGRRFLPVLFVLLGLGLQAPGLACTCIVAGREASADGAVLNSMTADGWYDSNLRVEPARTNLEGSLRPVYWGLLGDESGEPLELGQIPQAQETYRYFRVAYSCFNEHQLSISESTIGLKDELKTYPGLSDAVLTVEQLMILALERCRTARGAVALIGGLAERYGFLGSCFGNGESLAIADTREAWIMEIISVGPQWTHDKGPGAAWVARRVPDGEVALLANVSRIGAVDEEDPDFMFSLGYKDPAIKLGLWDAESKEPFNWRQAYAPDSGVWAPSSLWTRARMYYIHQRLAPSRNWDPFAEVSSYPFSFKPDRLLSVREIMDIFRSGMEGTPFDMGENPAWYVPGLNRELVRSPKATPFPGRDMRELLHIPYVRPVAARTSYSFVTQSRDWLPDDTGGVLWFSLDLPHFSVYVPIYSGVTELPEPWSNFYRESFSADSARWSVLLAATLVNHDYRRSMEKLRSLRDPFEEQVHRRFAQWETESQSLRRQSPRQLQRWINSSVGTQMEEAHGIYRQLCRDLIAGATIHDLW